MPIGRYLVICMMPFSVISRNHQHMDDDDDQRDENNVTRVVLFCRKWARSPSPPSLPGVASSGGTSQWRSIPIENHKVIFKSQPCLFSLVGKFGYQVALLVLVVNLVNIWRFLHRIQIWPPGGIAQCYTPQPLANLIIIVWWEVTKARCKSGDSNIDGATRF